jgi:hypothetical protein
MKFDVIDDMMAAYGSNENEVYTVQHREKLKKQQLSSVDVGSKKLEFNLSAMY